MTILRHADYEREHTYSADVIVVGTGAGGGAAAAELAEAGLDVIMVEEGGYHPTSSFNPYASESIPRLYRDASGTVILGKPIIPYIEGRCVGGSTVLNGGMTYRAPERVLDDWAGITGDASLSPAGMETLFQRVESRVHASQQLDVSVGEDNRIMMEGAKKMGWRYQVNRRNQEACVGTNNCVLGCPTGAKQSTLVSYIPRALAKGARCLTDVKVEEILIEGGRAVGVRGRAMNPRTRKLDREVVIRARAVVISCGAVQTPLLLQRHKLAKKSGQLGKNFLVHPNAKVVAIYPHEVRGWQGVSQLTQIREFHDEGLVMAENFVPPAAVAAYLPVHGKGGWDLMQAYNRMVVCGVLVEDSTTGYVKRGPFGMPIVRYDITDYDHARFKRGVRLLAEMHFAMGAEKVLLPFTNQAIANTVDDLAKIETTQRDKGTLELLTVHLMGTARMGADPRSSVVDSRGELWDLPGCYVADASLFPTALGVNPQITIMALATRVANAIAERRAKAA
jgi:choline dehydrogenase-like flavoprotein